ncbi:MAG: hypothetical protein ACJ8GN_01235 [Longimicrobiaceae bacterium]
MRRTRIYLLTTAVVTSALAAVHAITPYVAHAGPTYPHLWVRSELGETCSGSCIQGRDCCRVVAPAPPP